MMVMVKVWPARFRSRFGAGAVPVTLIEVGGLGGAIERSGGLAQAGVVMVDVVRPVGGNGSPPPDCMVAVLLMNPGVPGQVAPILTVTRTVAVPVAGKPAFSVHWTTVFPVKPRQDAQVPADPPA